MKLNCEWTEVVAMLGVILNRLGTRRGMSSFLNKNCRRQIQEIFTQIQLYSAELAGLQSGVSL